jgi:large subunit ribosomal protein L23
MYNIIRRPLVTEKNTMHAESSVYAFEVDRKANKQQIREAVEKAFRVKVEDVRTLVCRGRSRRTRVSIGAPLYWKKALVRLKAGEKIQLFEGV